MKTSLSKEAIAIAMLRVALALMYLSHGIILKIFMLGFAGTSKAFVSLGFPWWLSYLVIPAEVVGGAMLLLGIYVRHVSIALLPILIGALFVKLPNGWLFDLPGGGWEYLAYLILLSVAQALLGSGAFALERRWSVAR